MSLETDLQPAVVPAIVKLIDIDLTPLGQPDIYHYANCTGPNGTTFVWNGEEYLPFPFEISNLEQITGLSPPRATLTIGNVLPGRLFGALSFTYGDLVGAFISYRKTLATYNGSSVASPEMRFKVSRKTEHNKKLISFELSNFLDDDQAYLPGRQMTYLEFPGLGRNKNIGVR